MADLAIENQLLIVISPLSNVPALLAGGNTVAWVYLDTVKPLVYEEIVKALIFRPLYAQRREGRSSVASTG